MSKMIAIRTKHQLSQRQMEVHFECDLLHRENADDEDEADF